MVAVPWRRVVLLVAAVATALAGLFVVLRTDGYPAVDATVARATRWFVDEATGVVVLADGFSGQTLARLEVPGEPAGLSVAQSASGVAVLDSSSATARMIDTVGLRIGPPQSVSVVAAAQPVVGVGQSGLVAVDPSTDQGVLVPPEGDQVPFTVADASAGGPTRVAPDGAVLTLGAGELARVTTSTREVLADGLSNADFTLVGTAPLVLDYDRSRVRLGDGDWVALPGGVPMSELVLQQPGPNARCGWLGADDRLWCVGDDGFEEEVEVAGLDIDGADLLSIAGNAGALVRRAASEIVRIDWKAATILDGPDDVDADVDPGASLAMAAATDLIWIDETDGTHAWAVHPWGINVIQKDDASSPLWGANGELIEEGQPDGDQPPSINDQAIEMLDPEPDDNGIDDPPVANPDSVTARSGAAVPVAVTANDFDPDGEAIAVSAVGEAAHGIVDVFSASSVSYLPEQGFTGIDQFDYTIVDGDGTEASATVTVELLPADTVNQAPVGSPDTAETGIDNEVEIDVLVNDIDPERDALRIDTFTQPDIGGSVREIETASGLPGLLFEPPPGAYGTGTFTYRPVDSFGAVGESVEVEVDIAAPGDNKPPIVRPDALRVRRDVPQLVPVLANDNDPDGDRLTIDIVRPAPPGLDLTVRGDQIEVVVRAGAARLSPFHYTVDDGNDHRVVGSVLVVLISDVEPNRPPIANADNATAVTGTQREIDVLANDIDPDNDPVILVSADQPTSRSGSGTVTVQGDRVLYSAGQLAGDDPVIDRFTYEITDGKGNQAFGEVTVRVLPEPVAAPPFARDDAATTTVDVPVTIDVLRNDGDPSGERPSIVAPPGCAGGGTAVLTGTDRVTFTPPTGQAGVFSCVYEVTNSQGLRDQATIVISVVGPPTVNLPPIVPDKEEVVFRGTERLIDLLENVSDPDGPTSALRVLSSTSPSIGTAVRQGRFLTFTAGETTGNATITYVVGDDDGGVTTGQLVVRVVLPDPIAPSAANDSKTIDGPGVATFIDVVDNDSDADGLKADLRVVSVAVQSGNGSATPTGNHGVTIVPVTPDFVGDIVATYTIRDAQNLEASAEVTLRVNEIPNRPPSAGDDQAEVPSGESVTVPIALNDSDVDGDPLTYSITAPPDPALGTARLEGGALVFDSVRGASGKASVGYTISDGELAASATVTIAVLPCVSNAPEAPDLFLQTGYQQPIYVDLNTVARNGAIVQVGPPLGAPAAVYTPPPGENGNVSFTYVVRNSCNVEDVGTVTIDVNQDPVGAPYTLQIGRTQTFVIPISALASDAEPLTITAIDQAPDWVSLVDANRAIQVNPGGRSGRADIIVTIADPGGLQVQVPVAIELVNQAPVANADVIRSDGRPLTIQPLANDSDPDGDMIALQSVPESVTFANGEVAPIQRVGDNELHIVPGKGVGSATFAYSIVDQFGLVSQETTVTIIVNSPPVAPQVDVVMNAGSTVNQVVPATDPDNDVLRLTIDDDPTPLSIAVDGLTLTITAPAEAANTNFSLRYTVTDAFGATASGLLVISVGEVTTTTAPTTTVPPTTSTTTTTTTTTTLQPALVPN